MSKCKPNKEVVAIAEQHAAELEVAGYPVDMQRYADTDPLLRAAFSRLVNEREAAGAAAARRRDAWTAG